MASSRSEETLPNGSTYADDKDYDRFLQYPDKVDYYSLLGLSRYPPPTDSQLQTAYHNLSLSLHPDKQPPHLVEAANAQFRRIQEAYTTLIDPKKRVVYDLEGEEGVEREWSAGGRMSTRMENGDASLGQVGPRAMPPAEFRRWFLARMKARERAALEELVGAKGSVSVTVDASSWISPGEEEDELRITWPPPMRVSRYVLGYNFKAALPDFSSAWTWFSGNHTEPEEEISQEDDKPEEQLQSSPEVTFHTSINGAVVQIRQPLKISYEDGTTEIVQIDGPRILGGASFNLGASINHSFPSAGLQAGPQPKLSMRSLLDGASVGGTLGILPTRTLSMHIQKQVVPFPNGKPFTVLMKTDISSKPNKFMPKITTFVQRPFGLRKFGTLTYTTGSRLTWPSFVRGLLSPFIDMSIDPRRDLLSSNNGSLQLQYTTISDPVTADLAGDPEIPKSTRNEIWQWSVAATPVGGGLNLTYSRNFFADKLEDVPRSEWNLDGYHPTIPLPAHRGVRVEVEASVDLEGGMTWAIKALRRVGDFTTMGLGVGLRDRRGLVMTVQWHRLGQSIKVPIMICPFDLADADISTLAVLVPCLTYLGIEFGYIRPQERRHRREAIIRKRKVLKSQIPMRQKESAQQIELMSDYTRRRQAREKDKGGLVVVKAEYGYIPPKNAKITDDLTDPKVIDATIPVAALVEKSRLFISKDTIRFQIIGFYDPAPLLPKTLKVWYDFHGLRHYTEAKDGEDLACPQREHMLLSEDL
ncbi:DnaJ domain protein [Talaromyces stipitatus ATCC 10500]|uniref:DnaJ domain protein n=1 Tax=Talaromyces stipitatus (strain ATCC 10500 / CBS 375.48 / QM 6759 / NRRL 1006) TaxID=441959 RepID=B8MBJ8_TALSN|nr:DnaJ domain protein [Talaromyces stipitatus ATCC 10500]EED17862.1 DnaJ domain protein [Talaromyces stipitatus ATCC 10500]